MSPMLHPAKLAELRSKTNRELSRLVADGVANALTLVKVAEAHYALGDFPVGERAFHRASAIYDECNALLPLLGDLSPESRRGLEQDLECIDGMWTAVCESLG